MACRDDAREALRGVLHFFSETGTEGGYWAFQDERFITRNEDRFSCAKCHAYWDRAERPKGPAADEHPDGSYCPPGTHEFTLVSEENWSYEGLHVLGDGDRLVIYERDGVTVAWEGVIALDHHRLFSQDAFGFWIHADQKGIERAVWATWFFEERPAKLVPAERPEDGGGPP